MKKVQFFCDKCGKEVESGENVYDCFDLCDNCLKDYKAQSKKWDLESRAYYATWVCKKK